LVLHKPFRPALWSLTPDATAIALNVCGNNAAVLRTQNDAADAAIN